jgi:hypothetical protein
VRGNLPTRFPWPGNFPPVVIHCQSVKLRDGHPDYLPAKSGSGEAAIRLANALIDAQAIARIRTTLGGRDAVILPVVADESMGFNAIPDGMAHILGQALKLSVVSGEIVQSNKVGHTRAPAFQRIVTPAEFRGEVIEGANYVLVDDHIGLGGTLANLRGYVEGHGGKVICMSTLTRSRDAEQISLTPDTASAIWKLHGQALDTLWQTEFGHGINSLTELEALNLCRQRTLADIKDFLAKAAIEARSRGLGSSVE